MHPETPGPQPSHPRHLEDELNESQLAAVDHRSGPLLLLAGAGSGKTRVITYRLVELLRRGADPDRVMAVTFTNKAAGELRERTERLLDQAYSGEVLRPRAPRWIGTFHSIGARLLRRLHARVGLPSSFVILDEDDQLKLCKEVLAEANIDELAVAPRALRAAIDRAKNQCLLPDRYVGHDYFTALVEKLYRRYQQRLLELGACDFGDLLLWPVVLAERDPEVRAALSTRFDHVLVDEFQDVNQVQYRLLRALAERHRNLVVVGDDDQAIYGWRGADVRLLLDFERDWPDARIIKLEENYRSSQLILDAAHAVVTRNPHRHDKRLYTRREGGEPILFHRALDERAEASFVVQALLYLSAEEGYELADCAVIYRTNAQSRVLEESLRAADVPYSVVGGMRFYDRAEVKDVLAYLRLCNNPADELALRRVINVPARGIGKETVGKLEAHARLGGVPLWQVAQDAVHSPTLLSAGPRKKLGAFVSLIQDLRALVGTVSIAELAKQAVQRTGYLLALDPEDPEDESRRQNVQELLGSIEEQERESRERIREAQADARQPGASSPQSDLLMLEDENQPLTLASYLTRVALQSGDELPDAHTIVGGGPTRGVRLLTAHAAKGLEFKVVVVTGLEDGLFPSLRQGMIESDEELQARLCEERRLAYVALTRARERLLLTCASTRRLYGGQARVAPVSRFVQEIPKQLLDPQSSQRTASGPPSWVAQAIGLRVSDYDVEGDAIDPGDPGGLRLVRDEEDLPTRYGTPLQKASGDDVAAALWSRGRHAAARAQSASRLASPRSPHSPHSPHPDEVRIEYEDGQGPRRSAGSGGASSGGLHVGQAVRHGRFGTGRITALSTGRGVLATVRFDGGETKTIDARFIEPADSDGFDGLPGDGPEGS